MLIWYGAFLLRGTIIDRRKFFTGLAAVFAAPTVAMPAWGGIHLPASQFATPFIPTMQVVNQRVDHILALNTQQKSLRLPHFAASDINQPEQYRDTISEIRRATDSLLQLMNQELPAISKFSIDSETHRMMQAVLGADSKTAEGLEEMIQWRLEDKPSEVSLSTMSTKVLVEMIRVHKVPLAPKEMPEFTKFLGDRQEYFVAR